MALRTSVDPATKASQGRDATWLSCHVSKTNELTEENKTLDLFGNWSITFSSLYWIEFYGIWTTDLWRCVRYSSFRVRNHSSAGFPVRRRWWVHHRVSVWRRSWLGARSVVSHQRRRSCAGRWQVHFWQPRKNAHYKQRRWVSVCTLENYTVKMSLILSWKTNAPLCSSGRDDVGDYLCRINIGVHYMKEKFTTFSCLPGYSSQQQFGCPGMESSSLVTRNTRKKNLMALCR